MRRVDVPERLFNSPRWQRDERWDVVVVGLPFAGGSLSGGRSALGPAMLRSVSHIISAHPLGDAAAGWWDYRERRLLAQGLRVGDAGDLIVDPMHAADDLAQLPEVLAAMRASCALLLVLGGDDSLSYWVNKGFEGVLVHLDAHEDAQPLRPEVGPHHANFISHLEAGPGPQIVQYGLRGLVQGQPARPSRRRSVAGDLAELRSLLVRSASGARAVALDVDVLEPRLMRSVTAPVPDGMSSEALLEALRAVGGAGRPVRQFSVMEFAPHPDTGRLDAMRVLHLVLRCLDAWLGDAEHG